jgi:S-adenosylmethionine/arginine decarboxylase-like enzyme
VTAPSTVQVLERPSDADIAAAWGMELLIDLTGCNPQTIRSKKAMRRFSRDLCKVIGMRRYRGPVLFPFTLQLPWPRRRSPRFAVDNPVVAGITLSQLIYTSNLTFHFAEGGPFKNTAYGNVFSCKKFDVDAAIAFIKESFGATGVTARIVLRGRK